jgi:hypothetical protein
MKNSITEHARGILKKDIKKKDQRREKSREPGKCSL